MDLARELEPLAEAARALLLAGRVARRRDERRRLAERPQQVALAVGELEAPAAAVGADHAVGAAGGAQRRAHERRDPEHLGVLRRHRLLDPLGDDHHLVLEQRALRDRRVDERRAQRRELRERRPVRADRADPAARGVGHEDRRAAHRRQPADRLADPVVELGRRRLGVDVGEQLDEHLERLDAREQRRGRTSGTRFRIRNSTVRSRCSRDHAAAASRTGGGSRTASCARPPVGRRGGPRRSGRRARA